MFFNQGKPHRFPVKPFQWTADEPLAPEHAVLAAFLAENVTETWRNYADLDLSASESGRKLQDADAASSARFVAALVGQLHHYDDLGRKARSLATSEMERINWHHSCPEWSAIWPARSALSQAVKRLMRRKLPLTAEHLTAMARWIGADEAPSDYNFPLKSFTKAIESLNGEALADPALSSAVTLVIQHLRDSQWKDLPKLAHALGKALGESEPTTLEDKDEAPVRHDGPDPAVPADAGSARVLVQLKNYLGTMPSMGTAEVETIGFDHFPLRPDTAFRAEHDLINSLLAEVVESSGYHSPVLTQLESGRAMLAAKDHSRGRPWANSPCSR